MGYERAQLHAKCVAVVRIYVTANFILSLSILICIFFYIYKRCFVANFNWLPKIYFMNYFIVVPKCTPVHAFYMYMTHRSILTWSVNKMIIATKVTHPRWGDKPLSEPKLTRFTDVYMRHSGEMSSDFDESLGFQITWNVDRKRPSDLETKSHVTWVSRQEMQNEPWSIKHL